MSSTFFGLEIANRALQTQQSALNVTGQNVSNANNLGYSRQNANIQATAPWNSTTSGNTMSVGTGSMIDSITRARDAFVDRQFRSETSKQQYWGTKQNTLQGVESLVNEPTDTGLSNEMNQFWTAWSDLANNPEDSVARTIVSQRATSLADSLHNMSQQISSLQQDQDSTVRTQIHQINVDAQQIAKLNTQIRNAQLNGDNPNDLEDKRDSLVDDLSKIVSVQVVQTQDPTVINRQVYNYSIVIGDASASPSQVLVDGSAAHLLQEPAAAGADGKPFATVNWADGTNSGNPDALGNTVNLGTQMGTLLASIEVRGDANGQNGYLSNFQSQYDTLANGIASAVNALQNSGQLSDGSAGGDFFTSTDGNAINASNITVNPTISADPTQIVTAGTGGGAGDGSVAQTIASLANGWSALQKISVSPPVSGTSFTNFYSANISQLGEDVAEANSTKSNEDALVSGLTNQRQSVSGVSLDEEMSNLIKFQNSYAAAARLVTMMDDMLNTIVSGMGLTR